LTNGLSS